VGTPKGIWTHPDPGRKVADAIGSPGAHTVLAEVGTTQQEVIDVALAAVRDGVGAALVVGAEVNHGSSGGAAAAVGAARSAEAEPDEHIVSPDLGISPVELSHLFVDPPTVYAVLEDAYGRAQGWSADEHHAALGALTESFAAVAAGNPHAWERSAPKAANIVEPSASNRMIAEPYTKLCCSNLRVNQAAALLLTTAERARAAGVPEERWVFCRGSAVCNHAIPVIRRPQLHRSAVVRFAGGRALELAGVTDVDHLDLYSCFPAAVQITAAELGIDRSRQLTVTGGMTFAGGPLNSYVLHSTATMAGVLRADPGATGLVTSVSGFLTKFGAAVWSTEPGPWRSEDTTAEARRAEPPLADTEEPGDDVTVLAGTVVHARDGSTTTVDVVETPDGARSLRTTTPASA
jgi:acetyl-CoA C-acetyltransferase